MPTGRPAPFSSPNSSASCGLARAEGGDAAGLDVAGVVDLRGELGAAPRARALAVLGGVLAVGGVEEVDVVAARVVARSASRRARAANALEATVPPLEDAWKNWLSSNSQACAAWARNTVSTLRTGGGCPAARRRRTAWRACAAPRPCCPRRRARRSPPRSSPALARLTSWRKRRSSLMNRRPGLCWIARRLTASFMVRRRSRRERAPRLSQPSRT